MKLSSFLLCMFVSAKCFWAIGATISAPTLTRMPDISRMNPISQYEGMSIAPLVYISENGVTAPEYEKYLAGNFNAIWGIGKYEDRIYLFFQTKELPMMPVAKSEGNVKDGDLSYDDRVIFFINTRQGKFQLNVNANGAIFDRKDGNATWNGQWDVQVQKIGQDYQFDEQGKKDKGFTVIVSFPMAGIITEDEKKILMEVYFKPSSPAEPALGWSQQNGKPIDDMQNGTVIISGTQQVLDKISIIKGTELSINGQISPIANISLAAVDNKLEPHIQKLPVNLPLPVIGQNFLSVSGSDFEWNSVFIRKNSFFVIPNPSRKCFYIWADGNMLSDREHQIYKAELINDQGLLCASTNFDLRNKKSRYEVRLPWGENAPGNYVIRLGGQEFPVRIIELPEWINFEMPADIPRIPKPFEPLTPSLLEVNFWGRKVFFGNNPYPLQITSQNTELLASPIQLDGIVDGKKLQWTQQNWELKSANAEKAIWHGVYASGDILLTIIVTAEFDGMVRFDSSIKDFSGKSFSLERLTLTIPYSLGIADLFMHFWLPRDGKKPLEWWPKAGNIPKNEYSIPFTNFFWIGDRSVGLQWFAESDYNWQPAGSNQALQMKKNTHSVDLICNIIATPRVEINNFDFTFGLMAGPVKPFNRASGWHGMRSTSGTGIENRGTLISQRVPMLELHMGNLSLSDRVITLDFALNSSKNYSGGTRINLITDFKNNISLEYDTATKELLLLQHAKLNGQYDWNNSIKIISKTPASLIKDRNRISWKRSNNEVWLNGEKTAISGYNSSINSFEHFTLGRNAPISIFCWRLDRNCVLPVAEDVMTILPSTLQLVDLSNNNPLLLNCFWAKSGGAKISAYPFGPWTYDGKAVIASAPTDKSLKDDGVKTLFSFSWSKDGHGSGGPNDKFDTTVKLLQDNKINYYPYTLWGVAGKTPWLKDFIYEQATIPNPGQGRISPTWVDNVDSYYTGATESSYRTYTLWCVNEVMKRGASGLYLDSYSIPRPNGNPMTTELKSNNQGEYITTMNIFSQRDMLWDMYRLCKYYNPDAQFDMHSSRGVMLPTMSMTSVHFNGENIGALGADYEKVTGLDAISAEYNASQFGWQGEAVFYSHGGNPMSMERGMTLLGLHGLQPRANWGMRLMRATKLWALADSFETNKSEFIGFYDKDLPFSCLEKDIVFSAFCHQGQRLLLLVTKWDDGPNQDIKLKIDWQKLGFTTPPQYAVFVNTGTLLTPTADGIKFPVASRVLSYVWIDNYPIDILYSKGK